MNRRLRILILGIFCLVANAQAQNKMKITGKITDEHGEGFPGVNVLIQGTSIGTATDVNGNYAIEAEAHATLVISFVGYETQTIPVDGRPLINITLTPNIETLSEIIVVGYGTQKKSDLISSVATVKPTDMIKVVTSDVGEMLRGRVPGVLVSLNNAAPGGSSTILIRGRRSLTASSDPIVIADGVPVGNINDINPNDIASMEVLKDAAAQAIYGARASNGVILITTKRGGNGKTSVNYTGYYGVQTVKRNFDVYTGQEFADLKREAARTSHGGVYQSDQDVFTTDELETLQSGKYIDWEKELLRLAPIQTHNLSLSTGSETTSLYSSVNYMNQQGVVPGTDYQRAALRLNGDHRISNWLKIGFNTSVQISQRNDPGTGGTLQRTVTTSPLGKIYNDDGTYKLHPTGVQESFNPLLDIHAVTNLKRDRNDILNLFIDVSPFKGFNYRLNASRRSWNRKSEGYSTKESLAGVQTGSYGQGYAQFDDNVEYQIENIFTYQKSLNKHNFNVTAVQSVTESKGSTFYDLASQLPNDLLGIYGLEAANSNTPTYSATRRALLSFVGRIQYDYDGKYYITASARSDASTVFGKNNKWAQFPAIGIGWNVHKENFFDNISVINNLKLRASYGSVGNQAINPYTSQGLAQEYDYYIDGKKTVGYAPGSGMPNPNLRWETSTTLNAAVDFGLWQSRITGTFEYYDTRTKDLLVDRSINAILGYTHILTNLGEVQNTGIELSLNAVAYEQNDWTVNIGAQFTRNRNKIISLYGTDADGDGEEDNDVANRWFIGQPIDVYYQYKPIGIWQQGEDIVSSYQPNAVPGDIKILDRDVNGVLDANDRVITQRGPKWYGSVYLDVNYKGVDLSMNVVTVQGVTKDNPYLYGYSEGGSLRGVFNGIRQNYWTPENPTGNWPRPNDANDPTYIYTLGLQNASYTRIQNVTLGYSLNKEWISKVGLGKVRIYATAQNPLTVTRFQSYSPEKNPNEYPAAISYVGGVQIGF